MDALENMLSSMISEQDQQSILRLRVGSVLLLNPCNVSSSTKLYFVSEMNSSRVYGSVLYFINIIFLMKRKKNEKMISLRRHCNHYNQDQEYC